MKTIGILGGTFDPVHKGHVQSALELKKSLDLDEVRLLPCRIPPHRQTPGCGSEQRLAMLKLAIADSGADNILQIDDRELKQNRISYSVETLRQLRDDLGDEVALIWIMGTDAFAKFDHWHDWQNFMSLAHIVVMQRPDYGLPSTGAVSDLVQQHRVNTVESLSSRSCGYIVFANLTPYPISATAIRQRIKEDKEVSGYLSPSVLHYINTQKLYAH